jgi:DMSO/TMAO reductase YedYZ molybdopterin-dependent catalytic subunit
VSVARVRQPRGAKPSSLRYYQDGPPVAVDLDAYQLLITGVGVAVSALTWDRLQALPRVEQNRRRVCVCNWSIRESWSGFLLESVLEQARWNGESRGLFVKQVSIGTPDKGVYDSTIPLEDALQRAALIADRLDGLPLALERGFPLRLLDFGLYSYKGVKGLASLEITQSQGLGVWERKAGYSVTGEIQPKRYRICDLGEHRFVDSPGEVSSY